ncbi:hypothetical protein ACIG0C_00545 [Kitasatospora aureofaciens]|uniref:Uncharacterized protein n=1 Tax=Kitasatospora aureofaciens TaxID=1894 RepID=A0A8H9HM40_KITAU|nr:hypothetical protein [Kitasatospora aureofaciens]GGU65148.1 hypothetical protein GCM10010502_14950 [Kitasatospora aureofaciens]
MSERAIERCVSREAAAERGEVGGVSERSERAIERCVSREAAAERSEVGA